MMQSNVNNNANNLIDSIFVPCDENEFNILSSLNVLYTNADCFTNKREDLSLLLSSLSFKPSAIIITEVNSKVPVNNLNESEFNLNGYNLFSINVGLSKKRGIIIYIDNSFSACQIEILSDFSEVLCVQIKHVDKYLLTICAVYRSPNSTIQNDLLLLDLIKHVSKYSKLLLAGDFNFSRINWSTGTVEGDAGSKSSAYKFISCLNDLFLTQHVSIPTRSRGTQTPHILDLVISNGDFISSVSNLSPLGKSDHSVLHIVCNVFVSQTVNTKKYNFSKGNFKDLCNDLSNNSSIVLLSMNDYDDVNSAWNSLKSILQESVDKHIPLVKSNSWKRKESWSHPLDKPTRDIINRKHRLWTRYQETKSSKVLLEFKTLRNIVRKITRNISKNIQLNIAKSCKSNPKKFWQYVNSRTCSRPGVSDLKFNNGSSVITITDDVDKAETFSNYFANIYTSESNLNYLELPQVMPNNFMPEILLTESEVAVKLSQLKIDKSPGPDLLHPRILYETRNEVCSSLTSIFNKSLQTGSVPADWKNSTVSVIFKKGKKDCVENYRPISLTCIACKVMESIIRDYILKYFLENNLFSPKQFGFIPGRSTTLQLLRVVDDWSKSLEQKGQIDIIYTDFEKAFDKVPHHRLLSKLNSYGINEQLIRWVKAFLSNRVQCVRINDKLSGVKPVLSGIPQGSVLGPVLFVIFINDLPLVCNNLSESFLFADDSKLYKHISNHSDVVYLNSACQNVYDWCNNWLMKLNVKKCKVLSIARSKNDIVHYDYGFDTLEGESVHLEHVSTMKDLGVVIDSELSYSRHIYDKINLAYRMLGIINRNFNSLDTFSFIMLYKSLIRSHLEFSHSVWSPYKITIINDLEKVQKRATKMVHGCRNMSYIDRLKLLNLPTLKYRRMRGDMIDAFKIINEIYDAAVLPVLTRNFDSRTRGNSFKLRVNRCTYDLRKYSFCNRIISVWNSLDDYVVTSPSVNSFKNNLDKFWNAEDFKFDHKAHLSSSLF